MKNFSLSLLIVVGLASVLAGFFGYRQFTQHTAGAPGLPAPAQRSEPAVPEESLPPIPADVPDVRLPDLAGHPYALRQTPGRTRLFNFWASWCEPCRREIPLLNALQAAHKAEGLKVVGIAVDSLAAVQTFLKATPLHYTVVVGEQGGYEAAEKFGMPLALPFTIFADSHNRIVTVKVGELHPDEADAILKHMSGLSDGKETLAGARSAIAADLAALATARAKPSARS